MRWCMTRSLTLPVVCRTGLFDYKNGQYKALLQNLSDAASDGVRWRMARVMADDAATVMSCDAYNEGDFDCRICRQVAVLRLCSAVAMLRLGAGVSV